MHARMDDKRYLILLTLGALGLRLLRLGAPDLWYDEAFTRWVTSLPLGQMFQALRGDTHPPLYYLLIWLVRLAGDSEFILRLPAAILSAAAVPVVFAIAHELRWPRAAAWAGCVFMAVGPFQIAYGQEARMYALFQLLLLLALWAVLYERWVVLCVVNILALYTHNYALIYLPVLLAIVVVDWRYIPLKIWLSKVLLGFGVPVILWLPWLPILLGQIQANVLGGYWILTPTVGELITDLYMLVLLNTHPWFYPISVMAVLGGILLTAWRLAQLRPEGWDVLALWAAGPVVLVLLASIWRPILLFRAFIASTPALYLLLAWQFTRQPPRLRLVAAVIIVPLTLASVLTIYVKNHRPDEALAAQAVAAVRAEWQPGDVIVHANAGSTVGWQYLAPDLPQVLAPICGNVLGGLSPVTRAGLGIVEMPLEQLQDRRAWVVWSWGPTSPQCEVDQWKPVTDALPLVQVVIENEFMRVGIWRHDRDQ